MELPPEPLEQLTAQPRAPGRLAQGAGPRKEEEQELGQARRTLARLGLAPQRKRPESVSAPSRMQPKPSATPPRSLSGPAGRNREQFAAVCQRSRSLKSKSRESDTAVPSILTWNNPPALSFKCLEFARDKLRGLRVVFVNVAFAFDFDFLRVQCKHRCWQPLLFMHARKTLGTY